MVLLLSLEFDLVADRLNLAPLLFLPGGSDREGSWPLLGAI